jgi:hypothetical protein
LLVVQPFAECCFDGLDSHDIHRTCCRTRGSGSTPLTEERVELRSAELRIERTLTPWVAQVRSLASVSSFFVPFPRCVRAEHA